MIISLNHKVKFLPENSLIIKDDIEVILKRKEADLLNYLIENEGKVLSKHDILESVWGTQHRTDSTIKKIVFSLRETLGDNAGNPAFIKTIDRIGYQFIASVSKLEGDQEEPIDEIIPTVYDNYKGRGLKSITKLRISLWLSVIFLIGSSITLGFKQYKDINQSVYDANRRYIERIDIQSDNVLSSVLSPDGQYVAYSEVKNSNFGQNLFIKNLVTSELKIIENASYPAWSSDSTKVAFVSSANNTCVYTYLDLKTETKQELNKCAKASQLPAVEWSKDGKFLYQFFNQQEDSQMKVFRTNISSGHRELILSSDIIGYGYYIGHFNESGDKLYILESSEWTNTNIVEYDMEDNSKKTLLNLSYVLGEIAVVSDGIIFINEYGGVDKFSFEYSSVIPYLSTQTIPLNDVSSSNNEDVLLVGGHYYFIELLKYDTDFKYRFLTTEHKDQYPLYFNQKIYFVSDRNITSQIYSFKNGKVRKVSSFYNSHKIRSFDLIDEGNIVLGTTSGIYLNDIRLLPYGMNVQYSDGKVYFSKDEGMGSNIYSYSIDTKEIKKITYGGGFTLKIIDDVIYFIKQDRKGLWKLDNKIGEVLIEPNFPKITFSLGWFAADGIIYASERKDFSLFTYDIAGDKLTEVKNVTTGSSLAGDKDTLIGLKRRVGRSYSYRIKHPR